MRKLLLVSLTAFASAYGAAGDLDPGFGLGGRVEAGIGHNVIPRDAVLQPDGKLIVAGTFDNFRIATEVFGVARFQPNGRLDAGFGFRGLAIAAFTNFLNTGNAVALQSDGKIVLAGEAMSADASVDNFAVARFNADGTADATFGNRGRVTTDFLTSHSPGFHQAADVVLIQPDGKILVGGVVKPAPHGNALTALARYNADGSLDSGFGGGGKVAVLALGNIQALALLSGGEFVAVNSSGTVAQFASNGSLVPVTGGTITAMAHTGTTDIQPDGRILLCGTVQGPGGENDIDVKVTRFGATGGFDPTFNSPAFDFGGGGPLANVGQAIAVAPNAVVIGGFSQPSLGANIFGVARLNADGSLDSAFGSGGKLTTTFRGSDMVVAIVVQPDGKIVAVGQTLNQRSGLADFAIARYLGQ